jgi:hypothetical protein
MHYTHAGLLLTVDILVIIFQGLILRSVSYNKSNPFSPFVDAVQVDVSVSEQTMERVNKHPFAKLTQDLQWILWILLGRF